MTQLHIGTSGFQYDEWKGTFYPDDSQFGSAYAGQYFFADFCGNWIRVFDPQIPGSPATFCREA